MRWFLAATSLVLAAPAAGQTPGPSRSPTSCLRCRIVVARTVTLGAESGFNSLPTGVIAGVSDYLVVFGRARNQMPILVSKEGGRGREFGRAGRGPGEHAGLVGGAVGPGDSIMVFDPGNSRLSIYSPDFRYVRSFAMPRAYSGVWLAGGTIVLNATLDTPQRFGQPFHVISSQGEIIRSFGDDARDAIVRATAPIDRRLLAVSGPDEFWAADADRAYRVQRWSAAGKKLADFSRAPDWFPARDGPRAPLSPESPPDPVMVAISSAGDRMIWVATLVPGADWKKGLEPRRITSAEQKPGYVVRDPSAVYDTRIQLLDAETGAVIAETRVDDAIAFALGGGLFGAVRLNDDDTSVVDLMKVAFQR